MNNEEYLCLNCNAILNEQDGFDPDIGIWKCEECGTYLYSDENGANMHLFNGTIWICDSCGEVLSIQDGFWDGYGNSYRNEKNLTFDKKGSFNN